MRSVPLTSSPPPRRILVRGVNWLGDAVMSLPAVQRLREALPEAHIVLATPRHLAAIWEHVPAVNAVLPFDRNAGLAGVAHALRRQQCDLALILPNSPRSALEAFLARVPRRVGVARPWRNWFLTQAVPPRPEEVPMRKRSAAEIRRLISLPTTSAARPLPPAAHQIHLYLHLAAAVGANPEPVAPRIPVAESETRDFAAQWLRGTTAQQKWFGLNPGARYGPAKRWPLERYVAAAVELHRQTDCGWLIFGGPEDEPVAREAAAALRTTGIPDVVNMAGRTNLRQLCVALRICRVLLTNDSGPMHVAAAVGTPVVVPFGSTSPEWTAPGLPGDLSHRLLRSYAPCAPCFLRECPIDFRCMKGIGVETVVQAALQATRTDRPQP